MGEVCEALGAAPTRGGGPCAAALFQLAVAASVAAIVAAGDTAAGGAAGNAVDVARSDRVWAWAIRRWGEGFLEAVAPRVFPAAP